MLKILETERPKTPFAIGSGLALAGTCLIKTVNLALIVVVLAAFLFKIFQLAREKQLARGLSILGAFLVSLVLPLGIWFGWNERHFGDLTASKSKIELLGWTPKPFGDWWSHPIFTLTGMREF